MRLYFFLILAVIVSGLLFISQSQKLLVGGDHYFSRTPVLHEGRIKSLGSFANIYLKRWGNPEGLDAADVLKTILFDPQTAAQLKIFEIRDPQVLTQIGLGDTGRNSFSFDDLFQNVMQAQSIPALLTQDPKTLTLSQNNLIDVYTDVTSFADILGSFSLIRMQDDIVFPEEYVEKMYDSPKNYIGLSSFEQELSDRLVEIVKTNGDDISKYNENEQRISQLTFRLKILREQGERSRLLKIMPADWDDPQSAQWYSPWELILSGNGSPKSSEYLKEWEHLSAAVNGDSVWDFAAYEAYKLTADQSLSSPFLFELEILYNEVNPYDWARGLYFFGALIAGFAFIRSRENLLKYSVVLAALGASAHGFAIVSRVLILSRPPVGTLYESVIFVALICALGGMITWHWRGNQWALLAGIISALALLLLAPVLLPNGESLEVLVAVLNTNFWLATHVTIITAGYGVCIIAALMAHFYMGLRLKKDRKDAQILKLGTAIHRASLLALLLTAVGTVLGGIWADQSWGRFWGWDPKENGALLIVLWLIWAQHGRQSGNLRELSYMAMIGFLNIIVGIAWFGVNLLGVGLHSYGFTSGLAYGLGAFCAAEVMIIGALFAYIRFKERGAVNAA